MVGMETAGHAMCIDITTMVDPARAAFILEGIVPTAHVRKVKISWIAQAPFAVACEIGVDN